MLVMLVPATVACFIYSPYDELTFIASFDYKAYIPIGRTFNLMFGESWKFVWPVVVIGVFQVVASSLAMSAIDRHFRTGKLSLRSPARLLNYSIFPLAVCVAIMCVTAIVLRFVLFGLVGLVQVSFKAMGVNESVAFAVICVLAVAVFIVHVLVITPMLFWQPAMFIYGYKFRDAAASSIKLMSGKKLYRGILFPLLIVATVQLIFAFLNLHQSVTYIVGFVTFLITNVYVVVYVIVSFYTISDLDRRDLMPYRVPLPVISAKADDDGVKSEKGKAKKQSAQKADADTPVSDDADRSTVPADKKPRGKSAGSKSSGKPSVKRSDGKQSGKKSDKPSTEELNDTKPIEPTVKKSNPKKSGDNKKPSKKSGAKRSKKADSSAIDDSAVVTEAKEEGGDVV